MKHQMRPLLVGPGSVSPNKENRCPECGEEAETTCRCPRRDSVCKNGHEWHTCFVHKVIVVGQSDHRKSITSCTCKKALLSNDQIAKIASKALLVSNNASMMRSLIHDTDETCLRAIEKLRKEISEAVAEICELAKTS